MPGLSDLFGRNGVLEQLLLWNVAGQVTGALLEPGLTLLQQDMLSRHPVTVLDPATMADLAARGIVTVTAAETEAARSGVNASRFAHLAELHTVRLSPADLATAVLRSYMTHGEALPIARKQGIGEAEFSVLADLAGDAPGPQQLATALRRGLIPHKGKGPASTSFEQGISESRLHDKWAPLIDELSRQLLSPADAASAVVRNFIPRARGLEVAGQQGLDPATFETLVHLSGDAPGPQQLAEALRRGLIPADGSGAGSTSFNQGIAEGRLADKWAPVIKGLAQLWPTPVDALDAALKGQITAAEGRHLYQMLGGDLQFYDWLLASIGDSPTPLEAATLAARGIIAEHGLGPGVLSYDQAVKESRYRNKWGPAYRKLSEHIPPPSTVVSMLAHRNIGQAEAHKLLLQNDMTPQLAAAYISEAEYEAISDYRGLTQAAVTGMYVGHILTRQQALDLLDVLHVSKAAAGLLLDYADMRYVIDSVNHSVQRIATLFVGRKISIQTAKDALTRLQIDPAATEALIEDWELQAAANVKILSESQIVDAWYLQVLTQAEAVNALAAIGYTAFDAWVLLSNKAKGPLPGKPPNTAAPPPNQVIPGVT
jgi:hypothetical protein